MRIERSPSPSQVGFSLGRRQFVIGATAAALLAACGDDDAEEGTAATTGDTAAPARHRRARRPPPRAPRRRPPTSAPSRSGRTTPTRRPRRRSPRRSPRPASTSRINTVDHNTYQENFNTYIQQPDDVVCWFAGYRMRAFATKGVVGDVDRRVGEPARHERGFQERLDRARRQAVLRPVLLLPMGRSLPPEPVRREGLRDPGDVGRVQGAVRPDDRRWHHPAGGRQRRRLAADGHVRHAQPPHQRLRLPHLADGWQGELDRRPGDRRVHALERDHRLLPARCRRTHVAGRGHRPRQQGGRDVPARDVRHQQLR